MGTPIRRRSPTIWMIFALATWLFALVAARASAPATAESLAPTLEKSTAQQPKPAAPQAKPAPQQTKPAAAAPSGARPSSPAAKYVGDEPCATCHVAQAEGYAKTPHHQTADPRTPAAAKGCETCHGPGSEHAADPVNVAVKDFKTLKSSDANAVCTTCHNKGEHALWDGSKHEARGLACTTCHSVHSYESKTHQLKKPTESELCGTCHRDKVAKLDRTTHMPVSEGKLECTSCHSPHGSTNVKLLRVGDSVNALCTSCHADKRGPYLWEHAPVRQGCTTCHDPHGSQNDSLLVAKLPMLCQRCHISTRHPSTLYDATQLTKPQLENRGCVNCHIQIHGSMHPVGQFFLR